MDLRGRKQNSLERRCRREANACLGCTATRERGGTTYAGCVGRMKVSEGAEGASAEHPGGRAAQLGCPSSCIESGGGCEPLVDERADRVAIPESSPTAEQDGMAICSRFVSNFRDGSSQYSTRGVPETATRRYHLRTGVAPFDARAAVRGRPRVPCIKVCVRFVGQSLTSAYLGLYR